MKRISVVFIVLVASLGLNLSAWSATVLLDDSQSQVLQPQLGMQWRSISPAQGDHQVVGSTRVQIRLNTQAIIGQTGRIFMVLPAQPSAPVQVQWQTQGMFINGQLQSGSRALVWQGKISAAMLEDVMSIGLQTDGRFLQSQQALRFHFEWDVP
jgi:hypothetical protein